MRIVLDARAAVAWYLDEPGCEAARKWQTECLAGRIDVLVPSLHFVEFANVLQAYVRRRELTAAQAQAIYELHLDAPLTIVEPDRENILRVALEYETTAYDATHVQIALAHDALLVTAVRAATPWLRKLGRKAVIVT